MRIGGIWRQGRDVPLHIWLPKAHPVAPAPASALLSGILTKSGVFGVLILCRYLFWTELPWNTVVLALGVVTMVLELCWRCSPSI